MPVDVRMLARSTVLSIAIMASVSCPLQASETVKTRDLEPCSATIEGESFEYVDACSTHTTATETITIDVRVTKERAELEYLKIELPFSGLRTSGPIVQVFYSGAMGKAQWFRLDNAGGLALMPNGLMVPVRQWVGQGLRIGSFLRVVVSGAE